MSPDERILLYLWTSIAERGGTGRRLGRIQVEMVGPYVEDSEFRAAIRRLVQAGSITLDEAFPGMVYAVPVEAQA